MDNHEQNKNEVQGEKGGDPTPERETRAKAASTTNHLDLQGEIAFLRDQMIDLIGQVDPDEDQRIRKQLVSVHKARVDALRKGQDKDIESLNETFSSLLDQGLAIEARKQKVIEVARQLRELQDRGYQ
jgi:hypothetical protein